MFQTNVDYLKEEEEIMIQVDASELHSTLLIQTKTAWIVNSVTMHNTPPLTTAHVLYTRTVLMMQYNFTHTFYYMVGVRPYIQIKLPTKEKICQESK